VAGQLQVDGRKAFAAIVATNFTPTADSLTFDLRAAYRVDELQKLNRTFEYQRGPAPALTVRDEVAYATPQTFECSLITWGGIARNRANEMTISEGPDAILVNIDTGGEPFHLTQEVINEDVLNHHQPTRLGIVLDHPVSHATVTVQIRPAVGNVAK